LQFLIKYVRHGEADGGDDHAETNDYESRRCPSQRDPAWRGRLESRSPDHVYLLNAVTSRIVVAGGLDALALGIQFLSVVAALDGTRGAETLNT
jgi:hypothetical protein